MKRSLLAASISGALIVLLVPLMAAPRDLFDLGSLDTGPFARMSTLYEKSFLFLKVDVLNVEVRFGSEVAEKVKSFVQSGDEPSKFADSIADTAIHAQDAFVHIRFLRNIRLKRFIQEARESTKLVREAGIIDNPSYEHISNNLPIWYGSLAKRGIREGDEMFYRIRGESLRAVFRGVDGTIYVDLEDKGSLFSLAVLGGYFVEKSKFRKGLLQSLFLDSTSSN
ncbi:MAG: hypothetical protein E2P08_03655 [Acidobacteria bacterium]|nr:MAG: hypothetical protein E2P08_03655 [Acidobacteriota bacterium]